MAKARMMAGGLSKTQAMKVQHAYKKGAISKKQYDKLPPKMLLNKVVKMKKHKKKP